MKNPGRTTEEQRLSELIQFHLQSHVLPQRA